jgi:hypothetical protein
MPPGLPKEWQQTSSRSVLLDDQHNALRGRGLDHGLRVASRQVAGNGTGHVGIDDQRGEAS